MAAFLRKQAAFLRDWLTFMPARIGMTRISPAIVEISGGLRVTGMVLLAESHVAVHLDYETRQATVDVFSCKPFDPELVERYCAESLKLEVTSRQVLKRGLETAAEPSPHA